MTETKRQVVEEIHKPVRINFKRRKVILKSLNDLLQCDIVSMIPYAKENKGFRYILTIINCFSKKLYAFGLKTKSGPEVARVIEKVLKIEKPVHLQSDHGTEFYNQHVQKVLKKLNVIHYSVFSEKKASIVERVNRTLKTWMWKEFNFQGNYKWWDLLPKLVHKYNNTKHRTIGMKPSEVSKKNEKLLLQTVYSRIKIAEKNPKFKLGEHVRVSRTKGAFTKGYLPNWSTEIYTIRKVQLTNPTTYLLKDAENKNILGGFYEQELLKAKFPDVYLVEKILKRKNNKVFVKWLGFSNQHNSWIDKNNIM